MMDFSGRQHIPYNRELFAFLSGEQMGIPHGHGDVLMAHELLQFHERDVTGLRQPGGEGMSHGVQGDGVQTVAVFRGQIELSDGSLETGRGFLKRRLLSRLLEDGFRRLALIRLEHPDHILRHTDEDALSSFLNDIEAAGIAIHILPAQFENFRGTKAGSQREQSHIMQLWMPLFKVVQKGLGFFPRQETQPFIVSLYHLPSAALGGQGIDSAPHACGDGTVYGGTHKAEDVVDGLPGESFPLLGFDLGLFRGLFLLCIPGGSIQKLCLEIGKQIRGQLDNRQGVDFGLEVGAILAVVLINVLPFASAPNKVGIHQLPDGDFITLNRIDAGGLKLGKKLCPLLPGRSRTDAFAVPSDGFPMPFAFVVSVPEAIDFVVLSGSRIALGGRTEEDALELGLYVFSFSYVAHTSNIKNTTEEGKMLIQNLSKMNFQDKNLDDNYLNLIIIVLVLLTICDRERERESLKNKFLTI